MLRGAIQRPIAVSMLFLALVLIGIISYTKLPVDLLPSITYPRLTAVTVYEDIPAEDLERLVTQPIEEVVTALTGVRRVVSRTREGVSVVTVEYEWGTQMDFANLHLREAIDRVAFRDDFPEDADRPLILRWDPTSRPISILVLKGDGEIRGLTEFSQEVVKPALEQVDGVSQAEVVGGADREILVRPNIDQLAIYGVTIDEIRQAIASSNISFPGGRIRQGPLHLSLRIAGEFESLEQIRDTEIPRAGQTSIKVGDVAEVLDTVKEAEGVTLLGDSPVVSLLVYKEPDANTIAVSEEIDLALGALSSDYGSFAFDFVYRDAEYVRESFGGLRDSLIRGAGIALIVLFFFLRDFRSTLVVGLSIPISILITFALLYFGNVKLNLMSLGGLSLAAGMLVDNAIVVLENITRHLREDDDEEEAKKQQAREKDRAERGEVGRDPESLAPIAARIEDLAPTDPNTTADPSIATDPKTVTDSAFADARRVALKSATGTEEVARAVLAATLTTIAVFFPVVYVQGVAGAFFRDQALTVTFSLLISVTTALLLQPVLSARILRPGGFGDGINRLFKLPLDVFEAAFTAFRRVYHAALVTALRARVFLVFVLFVVLGVVTFLGTQLDRSFMPERSSGDLRLELELPAGTPLEETERVTARVATFLEDDPAVRTVFAQVGRTERTLAAVQEYTAPNTSRIRIFIHPGRNAYDEGQRVQAELTRELQDLPDAKLTFREEGIGLAEIVSTGDAPFSLGVVSEDPISAMEVATEIEKRIRDVEGLTDLQVDRVLGTPNMVVRLDREEILRSGLDPDGIAQELRNRIAGVEASTFNEIDQRIDIAVRLPEEQRRDLPTALASPIQVAEGQTVPLRSFLEVREERPVRELVRRNQRRMVTLSGNVTGRSVNRIWEDVDRNIAGYQLPPDVSILRAGEDVEMQQSFKDLAWAMVLAVVLVYMILAAQFESFLDPLLVAAVIPMGLAGSILAIFVTGNSINILSLIGVVALLGIAVNDAIVKIDTIRRLREDGLSGRDAVLEASRLRIRPILMTSITTVFAMIPMAIGAGDGEQLQRPLAITIIGGLTVTTALTLFYTPILYELAHRIRPPKGEPAAD